ncbi:SAF domain-containing protein [Paenibacillus mucilaginosus]|uniref:SAF domain-containing protein n=1 Tax=Paenibacillus mucilaginosus (strain KNP414) TaxID=1036673 RepID=F8FAE5_PAEMK|nr:SAF domain-containing protein [Paenibacillus mucilaginosus]AEI39598.1 hypothetical protein KNP414_01008 [Paenibacillus mucilaginosus KNP414]MCG7218030.1 SAF domain-containing protein [Paenibacillus mucilaginosus]WDM28542.1 SAF domain-containing protein [Paenibacillus mucilaginosus]
MQKAWIAGTLGCLLMGGSVTGYWQFMKHTEFRVQTMETVKPVRMLHSGEVVQASLLRKEIIPVAAHQADAVTRMEDVIGKTVLVPLASSEELVAWKLDDRRMVPGEGERYFSFRTDAAANVNNMVRRGDRVDVWVEFDQPKGVATPGGALYTVGAVKIIEGLPVTGVKTPEGLEVTDTGGLEAVVEPARSQYREARSKAAGKPELNTYIMSDEVFEAYSLGGMGGRIKLALPDLTAPAGASGTVTPLFRQLKEADAFTKTKPQVRLNGEPDPGHMTGAAGGGAKAGAEAAPASPAGSPVPQAKEVNPQ